MAENKIELLIQARDEASAKLNAISAEINKFGGATADAAGQITAMGNATGGALGRIVEFGVGMTAANLATQALGGAWEITVGSMKRGIEAIGELKMAQAAMAAAAATNDPALSFTRAYDIAGAMVEKVHELSATFVGTGHELSMLADSMVTFGMGLDLSNEKAQKNFVSFGNLMKIMTRGQDFQRQAYQEIRALMEGADVPGAMLVKKLEAAGVNVKEMVPLWREQGVLLDKIMEVLPGYGAAQEKIAGTLQTQKTTLSTIVEKILREGMAPAYEQITGWLMDINKYLYENNSLTKEGQTLADLLKGTWTLISGVIQGIGFIIKSVIIPGVTTMVDLLKKGAEHWGASDVDAFGMVVPGTEGSVAKIVASRQLKGGMESLEEERDKWAQASGMKLPGSQSQIPEAMTKAAEKLQNMIEDMADKISVERARARGGDVEAAFEKARIDWINRNRKINELAEASGKVRDQEEVNRALEYSLEQRTDDEIKALEKQRDAAIKETRKSVEEREKAEQHLADSIDKIRAKVAEREAQRQEKYLELMANYSEQFRQAQERAPRPWDAPGAKEREREMHDYISEQNKLEALRRRGEERLPGGIDPDRYQELMDKLRQVHEERMKQIEDTTSVATARVAQLWTDMVGTMDNAFNTIFMDAFHGKLQTLGDYFNLLAEGMAQAWSRALSNMLVEWIQTQARMSSEGGIVNTIGKWISGALGMGSGGGSMIEGAGFGAITYDAKGAVYAGGPRIFRFARGVGMLGEDGPEGVLPLKRTASGDLGVQVADGGGVTPQNFSIQIINETGTPARVRESKGRFNGQEYVITAWLDGYTRDLFGMRTAMGR